MGTEQTEQMVRGLGFGDYCLIEQKRFGCENEMFLYKVIGQLDTNYHRQVPVNPHTIIVYGEIHESIRCICCGVDETKVETFRLCDVKSNMIAPFAKKEEKEKVVVKTESPEKKEGVRLICTGDSKYREEQKKDCGNICCMDCEDDCICQCDVYMRETKYLRAKITKKQCECLNEL